MFRLFKRAAPVMLCAAMFAARAGAGTPATATLLNDRFHYPFNLTPGSKPTGSLFLNDTTQGFQLNLRDGCAVFQWQPVVPPALAGHPYKITKATISVWMSKSAAWPLGGTSLDGYPRRMELFAAGFGPTYTESQWNGANPYVGSDSVTPSARDPYPRDLVTNAHVEDVVAGSTPWAIGVEQAGYVPGAMTDAVRVDFEIDTDNPTVNAELRSDISSGKSTWVLSGVYDTTGGPGGGDTTGVPVVIFSEGVGSTTHGTTQQAPRLVLEFEPSSPARHWELFQ